MVDKHLPNPQHLTDFPHNLQKVHKFFLSKLFQICRQLKTQHVQFEVGVGEGEDGVEEGFVGFGFVVGVDVLLEVLDGVGDGDDLLRFFVRGFFKGGFGGFTLD